MAFTCLFTPYRLTLYRLHSYYRRELVEYIDMELNVMVVFVRFPKISFAGERAHRYELRDILNIHHVDI